MKAKLVVRSTTQCQGQVGPIAERIPQATQPKAAFIVGEIRHEHGDQAFAVSDDVLPFEHALRLSAAPLAERQQPAETGISGPVGRIDQHRHAVGEFETTADNQADSGRFRGLVSPDDTGKRVPVHHGQRFDPGERGLGEQLLARRGPRRKLKCEVT